MNYKSGKFSQIIFFILFSLTSLYSQTSKVDAGTNQVIKWEQTHSTILNGNVSADDVRVIWSCPANNEVSFNEPSNPKTKVTFPHPGYYLLKLTAVDNDSESKTVVINVFKTHSYESRLNDLISLMTVDEKISQLSNQADAIPRLGIPKYNYWSEALHGILDRGVTSFPQAVAIGATWDPELLYREADAISDEARVKHVTEGKGLTYWSPTINIARDPRWGRNEESYSEDPYLLSKMAVSFVKGMQGDDPYYLKTVSTPKHFIANNEEDRRHTGSSDVDMRSLFEYYMPAFKDAIVEGKAYSIMGAYNSLNKVPCCGNYFLLNDVLRNQWGFKGYVVSDCGAIHDMVTGHHFFETGAEAAARGILAGCDLNCGEYYHDYLYDALKLGLLCEKDLDRSLKRVLSARFKLGEFDPPDEVPYSSISKKTLDSKEHRDLALKAAQEAMVLLKNDGILPIKKDKVKSIAVIGPNAKEIELGIYSGWPNIMVSPLEGINTKAAEYGIKVAYTKGSDLGGGLQRPIDAKYFGEVDHTGKTGVKGEYYNNMDLSGSPVLTRIDSAIDFSWGAGSAGPGVNKDQFSVRWTGKIKPPENVYHLGTRTDDGARLYLDNKLLFDDWTEHGEKPNTAKVDLLAGKEYNIKFEYFDNILGASARLTWDLGQRDFDEAKEIARKNDIVILVLGTSPGLSAEELDRTTIELPEVQRELVKQVGEVNPNIVIVLVNNGTLALSGAEKYAKGIVEAWYAGEFSGTAIADVLFGDVNPGGKLPETFYSSTNELPPFWDYDIINNPRTYMYFEKPVLYPFGFGLSYTTFKYSNLKLSSDKIDKDGIIQVEFTIQNTGQYKGDEVAQVYIHDIQASVKVPIKQLKRFERITLSPNEEKTLSFKIPVSELSFYDIRTNKFKVEPGEFEIMAGSSSQDIRLQQKFTVE